MNAIYTLSNNESIDIRDKGRVGYWSDISRDKSSDNVIY